MHTEGEWISEMYSKVDLALLEFVDNLEYNSLGDDKQHFVGVFFEDDFVTLGQFDTIDDCEEFIERLTFAPFVK